MKKKSKLHIYLSQKKQQVVRWKNNLSARLFFLNSHSRLVSPLHTQYVSKWFDIDPEVNICIGARLDCYPQKGKKMPHVHIGSSTLIGYHFSLLCAESISIGNNCMFASDVFISDENHGICINGRPYISQPLSVNPVVIGNNVWVGEKCIILPGVHIGNNAVIGAGSVVKHDIPENSIAAGNPAHVIKIWNADRNEWSKI